jgi:hypothetical protein
VVLLPPGPQVYKRRRFPYGKITMTIRPAEIGDQGVLLGLESHGSIGTLILRVGDDEQAFLYGDWRMVTDIVEAFEGERVEVVRDEGSSYGAHGIRPLERLLMALFPLQVCPSLPGTNSIMNKNKGPEKQPSAPPVTLRKMPDGSFRIYGLRNRSRIHLTKEMRAWQRDEEERTGETFYMSRSSREADAYAASHGLTILEPTGS